MRWRLIFLALLASLAFARSAAAQPAACVDPTADWVTPYQQGAIQFTSYYVWQKLFAVGFRSGEFHLHVGVPRPIAQSFTSLVSADLRYNSAVRKVYHQALLAEDLCPLLSEGGLILLGETP